ncbi:MAG: hypothetical protein FJ005_07800 [Chloroflexi bacterium]|nr:hypothetical protein [Chloroflexota bacterium]
MLNWIGNEVAAQARQALKEEGGKDCYHARCPQCGRKQVRENLSENGCFVCGWKGTEEDIELAVVKFQSACSKAEHSNSGYKTNCPQCGAPVVTEEFLKNGCWRCSYKN